MLKPSDKLHIIDRSTFEKIQQQSNNNNGGIKIRNSKYKKTRRKNTFNLLHFLTQQRTNSGARSKLKGRCVGIGSTRSKEPLKRRGKVREGSQRKKISRLKKSILRYRLQKQRKLERTLNTTLEKLDALTITPSKDETEEIASAEEKSMQLSDPQQLRLPAQATLHSRRFRSYCDNCTTAKLGQLTEQLLRELDRFQKRAYAQNEIKARAHRRFVVGFREMQNFLRINKVKLAIIAPDCEPCQGESGLDETIESLKMQCQRLQVPYAFSLRRRQLSYALYKKVPVACVAILDYDGAREIFADLLTELQEARLAYATLQNTKKI